MTRDTKSFLIAMVIAASVITTALGAALSVGPSRPSGRSIPLSSIGDH